MLTGKRIGCAVAVLSVSSVSTIPLSPSASADNARLNNSVVANVYTVRYQAGCASDIKTSAALTLAAQRQADDVLSNRALTGEFGSDGSTPQSRAAAAGYPGPVAQTVAINPALAINNLDVINQWYHDPEAFATMSDCANTAIGVWSVNSLDRSVVVAVYGKPA